MAYTDENNANRIKLSKSDRELEDQERDIRGWPVQDEAGNRVGTVDDLLLNTDTEVVDMVVLDNGEMYLVDNVRVGVEVVSLAGTAATSDAADTDELRVQRSEEELRAGTREREAGGIRVRKQVKTDREEVRVPKRREEVSVDRVPLEEDQASEGEIGDEEISVPVTEEEVVVEKRPVVKEELRIRKDVVEDEEVVEEYVRKEEVEVDDETTRRTDR